MRRRNCYLLTFGISAVWGAVAFEIFVLMLRNSYVLDPMRAVAVGLVYGLCWIPGSWIARRSLPFALITGGVMPLLVPAASVIGLFLALLMLQFAYILIPAGILQGLTVFCIWRVCSRAGQEQIYVAANEGRVSDNPYEPPDDLRGRRSF